MDWKTIGIPLAAAVFAVLLGVKFLRPATSAEDRAAVEKLSTQYADLDSRMAKLEKTIAALSKDVERAVKLGESTRPQARPNGCKRTCSGPVVSTEGYDKNSSAPPHARQAPWGHGWTACDVLRLSARMDGQTA